MKTAKDWRATPPAAGPERPLKLPAPKRFTLPNGLTVMLFEEHRLPLVAVNLVVLAGSDRNPESRPGLASFTADVLDEGTKTPQHPENRRRPGDHGRVDRQRLDD